MTASRWTNPHQPQTLQIGVLLLYMRAAFSLLGFRGFVLPLVIAMIAGGWGIANEKKWGYWLGVFAALLPAVWSLSLVVNGVTVALISLMFDIALVALLVHPMSRDYQRIWFR